MFERFLPTPLNRARNGNRARNEENLRGICLLAAGGAVIHSPQNAIRLLETRRRKARPKGTLGIERITPLAEMASVNAPLTVRGISSLVGMREWLQLIGHSVVASNLERNHADKVGRKVTSTS